MILLVVLLAHQPHFGVNESQLSARPRYRLHSKEVARERIEQVVGNGRRLPDPAGQLHVTVIGPGREAVLDDLAKHPALEAWRSRVTVRGYAPEHWHVSGAGFVVNGKPTVYVQDATGVVLHRQNGYEDGAEALARALEGCQKLRKPSPDYKPERDLDRRRVPVLPRVPSVPWSVWALGGAAGLAVLWKRSKR